MVLLIVPVVLAAIGLKTAYAVPSQVSLTFGESPSEMVVMWTISDSNSTKDYVCEYGTKKDSLSRSVSASNSFYSFQNFKTDYTSPIIFQATMTELIVGSSSYYYRVGSPSEGFSDVFSFKTNPGSKKYHL